MVTVAHLIWMCASFFYRIVIQVSNDHTWSQRGEGGSPEGWNVIRRYLNSPLYTFIFTSETFWQNYEETHFINVTLIINHPLNEWISALTVYIIQFPVGLKLHSKSVQVFIYGWRNSPGIFIYLEKVPETLKEFWLFYGWSPYILSN